MLCIAFVSIETCSTITSVLIRVWFLIMLTLQKNNLNNSRKNESISFSLMQLKRSWLSFVHVPGFSLSTDSKISTSAFTDMIFCKTDHMKILKK